MQFFYENHANSSGIYKITNTHNNRVYIGQAKTFKKRYKLYSGKLNQINGWRLFIGNTHDKNSNRIGSENCSRNSRRN